MGRAVGGNAAIEQRLRAAQGLSPSDGHALAGFLDAEGTFTILPNNGGTTWACAMTVAVRLDDGDVLADLCRSSGLGHVRTKPAYRGSRPQATWRIASKRECLELARLLDRFPLRARKRHDCEIWSRAVKRWAASPYDARRDERFHSEMHRAADQLRRVRHYVKSPLPALEGPSTDLLAYFGGFFSGEGSFGLSGLAPRAVIKLRQDDRPILELFAARFSLGTVCDIPAYENANPSVMWTICATDQLARAVRLFEGAQLRGRKRREFAVWRDAAHERALAKIEGRRWDRARVAAAAGRLTALRTYEPPRDPVRARSSDETKHAAHRAHTEVLRAFAAEEADGQVTATAYMRARERHQEWPTRNTIASAFGGWARALEAAGLGSRVTDRARSRVRRA
jgi:hypothetical protein